MLPLKALMNAFQNGLGYADCPVLASALFSRGLQHHDAGLMQEYSAYRFNV